jgi:hypothetical protein
MDESQALEDQYSLERISAMLGPIDKPIFLKDPNEVKKVKLPRETTKEKRYRLYMSRKVLPIADISIKADQNIVGRYR